MEDVGLLNTVGVYSGCLSLHHSPSHPSHYSTRTWMFHAAVCIIVFYFVAHNVELNTTWPLGAGSRCKLLLPSPGAPHPDFFFVGAASVCAQSGTQERPEMKSGAEGHEKLRRGCTSTQLDQRGGMKVTIVTGTRQEHRSQLVCCCPPPARGSGSKHCWCFISSLFSKSSAASISALHVFITYSSLPRWSTVTVIPIS